jgi:hypothetical protein
MTKKELFAYVLARFTQPQLADYVLDMKAQEAVALNDLGVQDQLEYLYEQGGHDWMETFFVRDLGVERTPDGHINNCALANGDEEKNCQICSGRCPDRSQFIY